MFSPRSIQSNITFAQKIFSLDYILIFSVLFLGIISMFAMYSSSTGQFDYYTKSHISRFSVFFVLFLVLSLVDLRLWYQSSYIFYLLILILLLMVKYFGLSASGSKRWLDLYFINLQPSELMKIGIIIFLARYYHRIPAHEVNTFKYLLLPIFVLLGPVVLVMTQPDLGTALLIGVSGVLIVWLGGVRLKFFTYLTLLFIATAPIAISFLKPYQKARILTFLNPDRDPLGAGYQIIQSKIAIGSGGIFGKGFLQGSQSYLDYLPEKHTDFIFTLFSEEFGFFGSMVVLLLYALITWRVIKIGEETRSFFGKFYCYGFASAFFIYVVVNMGMVLGLLPIVGAPLPILSYGGSSMLAIMIGLGVVMSCKVYRDVPIN